MGFLHKSYIEYAEHKENATGGKDIKLSGGKDIKLSEGNSVNYWFLPMDCR